MNKYYSFKVELAIAMAICFIAGHIRSFLYGVIAWFYQY